MNTPPAQPSYRLRAIINVLTNWGGFALTAGINFFLSPFVVHQLGTTRYGAWVLLVSLVGYMGLFDLGVRSAVTKYVATTHATADHNRASQIASSSLALFFLLGLLAFLTSIVLALFVVDRFNIPAELIGTAKIVFVIGGMNVAISLVSGVPGGIIAGRQRFDLLNGINVGGAVLRATAVVLALSQAVDLSR